MRVRFTSDYSAHIEGSYRVDDFQAGQEFDGPFAQQLLDGGCPVEVVDGPAAETAPAKTSKPKTSRATSRA